MLRESSKIGPRFAERYDTVGECQFRGRIDRMLPFCAIETEESVDGIPAHRILGAKSAMSDCGSRETRQPLVGASAGCRPRSSGESYLFGLRLRTRRNV